MCHHTEMVTRLAFSCVLLLAGSSGAETTYSPHAGASFARDVYWGDTHLHSHLSLDANMMGNRSLSPSDAFRFARGEQITAHNGMAVKLRRPLDFLVVSDHAEYLGVMEGLGRGDELLLQNETARRWGAALAKGEPTPFQEFADSLMRNQSAIEHPDFYRSVWKQVVENADSFDDPGHFTAFIGYEWTSTPQGNNLHRIVLFRDGGDKAGQVLPFSSLDSDDPEDLWAFLARYEQETGGQAFSIPHNSNLSGGLMFPDARPDGQPLGRDYAELRARWEPIVEATQYKGDSETHPYLSPEDELADYETWDQANIGMNAKHEDAWFRHEYVRSALKLGLGIEASVGANPYRFGLIGSTDAHTSLATADEDDFWGKFTNDEPSPKRWSQPLVPNSELPWMVYEWQMAASGYAAVWATENTRAALFDAMRRRETYATTGPRMVVRLFGGWGFEEADAHTPDLARRGYAKGVPMGGVLPAREGDAAPTFLVSALKDPEGANLARVQVVKGWRAADGSLHEKVHDVAVADGADDTTVDVADASYTNTIGSVQLTTVWRDPEFDPAQPAFYYLRVVEIPTPRWTSHDAKAFGIELPPEVPRTTRERAYTSPIWYSPSAP